MIAQLLSSLLMGNGTLMLAGAVALAAVYAVWLYWGQSRLRPLLRLGLIAARLAMLALLVSLLFGPVMGAAEKHEDRPSVLVLLDGSQSMKITDVRKDQRDMEDAAMALGKMPFGQPVAIGDKLRSELATATRLDLGKGILANNDLKLLSTLGQHAVVRCFSFGAKLTPVSAEALSGLQPVEQQEVRGAQPTWEPATHLGSAIAEAVERSGGQTIAGVVVLTDGASNGGIDPQTVARQLGGRNVPLYLVGVGLGQTDDVELRDAVVPDVAFADDLVPVRVQIASHGYEKRHAELTVTVDGKSKARKDVVLTGSPQFEELFFEADQKKGTAKVEIDIAPQAGEATVENNHLERPVRILDEKIKVLYIEGSPRWEFRYLRAVLMRDRRIEPKFLMTEGDSDLARASKDYISHFPEEAEEAFKYDLVILGDVPASFFSTAQLQRLEELVRERGGSLLMIAGQKNAPSSYAGTPLAPALPVRIGAGKWDEVDKNVHPVVTMAGRQSMIMSLAADGSGFRAQGSEKRSGLGVQGSEEASGPSPEPRTLTTASDASNDAVWAGVKPLYRLPKMITAKPGTTVLATTSDAAAGEAYPLIAWQRYGSGKSLFVGTDRLFRLRFKTGDEYHVRFWVQAIQFLSLSRLLGDNQRIHLEVDPKVCQAGQRVRINASVLDEGFNPAQDKTFTAYIEKGDGSPFSPLTLEKVADTPGFYQGYFIPEEEGIYRLRADTAQQKAANSVQFTVKPPDVEQREPALQEQSLKQFAELSGGKYFTIRDLPGLAASITARPTTVAVPQDRPVRDWWPVAVAFLALTGVEWFVRRKNDLA